MSLQHQPPQQTQVPAWGTGQPKLGAGLPLDDPRSPLAPYFCRTSHIAIAALTAGVFLLLTYIPLWHTDIWGHLKFGQWIVQNQQLPTREPFSPFAEANTPSLHTYWLSQAGLYLTYHAGELLAGGDEVRRMEGGVAFLHLLHAAIVTLRCVIMLLAFRRMGCPRPLAFVGLVVMLGLSIGHLAVMRPQILGELFFACLLFCLSRPVMSRLAQVLIPLMFVVWANSHGSFAIGFLLLGVYLVGRVLQVQWQARSWNPAKAWADAQAFRLTLTIPISLVAVALLNPHGPWLLWNTFAMGQHPNVHMMDEWKSVFAAQSVEPMWIYGLSLGLVLLTPVITRRVFFLPQMLLLVVFALLPVRHVRMEVWWLMLTPWLALPLWAEFGKSLTFLKRFETLPNIRKTVMAGLIVIVAALWTTPAMWLLNGQPWPLAQAVSQATPCQAAGFAAAPASGQEILKGFQLLQTYTGRDKFPGVVFTSETLGDYFLWTTAPKTSVFMYSHVHLFPADHWKEVLQVRGGMPGWREVLDRKKVNMVVVEAEQHVKLRQLLLRDPEWQVVVDETGDRSKFDDRTRLLIALRKKPLEQ